MLITGLVCGSVATLCNWLSRITFILSGMVFAMTKSLKDLICDQTPINSQLEISSPEDNAGSGVCSTSICCLDVCANIFIIDINPFCSLHVCTRGY